MNKNILFYFGSVISLGYLLSKYFNDKNNYLEIIKKLTNELNKVKEENQLRKKELDKNINDIESVTNEQDYSHMSSYMTASEYLKQLEIVPNNSLYLLLKKYDLYFSLDNNKWYTKNDDNTLNIFKEDINTPIKNSQNLTKKLKNLKTIKNNIHLIEMWNIF